MQDQACERSGGKVFFATSHDPHHPAENAIDGRDGTYWISTGLYPQEIILQVKPTSVASFKLVSTSVRGMTIEGSSEERSLNFKTFWEDEMEDSGVDRLQVRDMKVTTENFQPIEWVKLTINSGWSDFCTVHQLQVNGDIVEVSRQGKKKGMFERRATHSDLGLAGGSPTSSGAFLADKFQSQGSATSNAYTELEVQIPMKKDALITGGEPLAPRKPDTEHQWT
mmetsp:Transcript_64003/g.187804  ORF Transcript_64003/g.187804 Transcript_64003/m.187804 type:complete len:224 (+) Transcript_64003:152-823(+)